MKITAENREELERLGYTIVPNVLSHEECCATINGLKAHLETMFPEIEGLSWIDKEKKFRPALMHGIAGIGPLGQSEVQWAVREKLAPYFAELWNVSENNLITSQDGFNVTSPARAGNEEVPDWLHTDQSLRTSEHRCWQGTVTLVTQDAEDAGFICVPGSHLVHDAYGEMIAKRRDVPRKNLPAKHWFRIGQDLEWIEQQSGHAVQRIPVPEGAMILWDSRLVHAGTLPLQGRQNADRWRWAVYVCQMPNRRPHWMSPHQWEAARARRLKIFHAQRTTNHWPEKPTMKSKSYNTYGEPALMMNPVPKVELTARRMCLLGHIPKRRNIFEDPSPSQKKHKDQE